MYVKKIIINHDEYECIVVKDKIKPIFYMKYGVVDKPLVPGVLSGQKAMDRIHEELKKNVDSVNIT